MKNILLILTICCLSILLFSHNTIAFTDPRPNVTISELYDGNVYNRMAIFVTDQTRHFSRKGALREVEDEFMRAVIEKGYTLAARSDIEQIVKEQRLQRSELTEKEIAQIGHILNVPAVLIVSINTVSTEKYQPIVAFKGEKYYRVNASISARLISVEAGEVLWISSYSGRVNVTNNSRQTEEKALSPVARVVASGLPSRK